MTSTPTRTRITRVNRQVHVPLPPNDDDCLPDIVRSAIEKHVANLHDNPTPDLVMEIMSVKSISFYKTDVLRYFLLQSPLRPGDLRALCEVIGYNQATRIAQEVAFQRRTKQLRGWQPRWS